MNNPASFLFISSSSFSLQPDLLVKAGSFMLRVVGLQDDPGKSKDHEENKVWIRQVKYQTW